MLQTNVKYNVLLEDPARKGKAQDYYRVTLKCANCEVWKTAFIKKGIRKYDVEFDCSNCGCKMAGPLGTGLRP